jgi:hypothetical protein
MLDIPLLTASDIDVRVASISDNKKGLSLLLYKDARVDMRILDHLVGQFGWRREHGVINDNLFCTVSFYDSDTEQWVSKQDVGTESNTEKQKGEASDAFKRACFNWGIGRELYTAPFIWIPGNMIEWTERNGKQTTYDKYAVARIEYSEQREISFLEIINAKTKAIVYTCGKATSAPSKQEDKKKPGKQAAQQPDPPPPPPKPPESARQQEVRKLAREAKMPIKEVVTFMQNNYNKAKVDDLEETEYDLLCSWLMQEGK